MSRFHIPLPLYNNPISTRYLRLFLVPISDLPLDTANAVRAFCHHSFPTIRQKHLSIAPYGNREYIPDPSRNQEAAHSPDPDRDTQGHCDEEGRNKEKQRNANPEEGEEDCGDEGQDNGSCGEGNEEEEWREGEGELDCKECLLN